MGLIAEYPNKIVWKRWQTQRFVRRTRIRYTYVICVLLDLD